MHNVDHDEKEHKEPYSFAAIQDYLVFGKYPPLSDKQFKLGLRKRSKFFTVDKKGSCITLVGRRVSLGLLSRAQKKGKGLSQQFTIKHTLEETNPV